MYPTPSRLTPTPSADEFLALVDSIPPGHPLSIYLDETGPLVAGSWELIERSADEPESITWEDYDECYEILGKIQQVDVPPCAESIHRALWAAHFTLCGSISYQCQGNIDASIKLFKMALDLYGTHAEQMLEAVRRAGTEK